MNKLTIALIALVLALPAAKLNAQIQVNWGAQNDYGIGTAAGVPLAQGDLVEIGGFNITAAAIQTDLTPLSSAALNTLLSTNFTLWEASTIGTNTGVDGSWSDGKSGLAATTTPFSLQSKQIYILAFNAATVGAATQVGIFTATANSSWVFPTDASFPLSTQNIDLDQADHTPVIGGYGVGTVDFGGGPNALYNLNLIPEPSTWAGLAGGVALIGALVARRRKAEVQELLAPS